MHWRDLRDLAASVLISQGASVVYVSRILGHANPAITLSIHAPEWNMLIGRGNASRQHSASWRTRQNTREAGAARELVR